MFIKRPEQVESLAMQMPDARGVRMRLMIGQQAGASHFAMRLFEVVPGGTHGAA